MYTGPHIIKDGLVFGYDTGYGIADNNTATRFYPGESSVNLVPSGPATGTGNFSRQSAHNESFTYSKVTNYKGRADVHKLYINPSGNTAAPYADFGGQYHKSGGSAVGDVYAISFDFYVAKGTNTPGLSTSYVNGYKSPTNAAAASLSANNDVDLEDGWTRRTRIATIITAGNTHWRFGCNTNGNETEVYIDNVQIELKPYATPFVDGTRSSTSSLIDLKQTTDINVSNVTFDSTGQPEFDGSDDRIVSDAILVENSQTFETVFMATENPHSPAGILTNHQYTSPQSNFGINYVSTTGNKLGASIGYTDGTREYDQKRTTYVVQQNVAVHAVLSYDQANNRIKWYINGELDSTHNLSKTPNFASIPVCSGRWTAAYNDYYFDGNIYVGKIYNRELTASEVKQNFNAYKNRFDI